MFIVSCNYDSLYKYCFKVFIIIHCNEEETLLIHLLQANKNLAQSGFDLNLEFSFGLDQNIQANSELVLARLFSYFNNILTFEIIFIASNGKSFCKLESLNNKPELYQDQDQSIQASSELLRPNCFLALMTFKVFKIM